jgi:hypothetical protein
MKQAIVTVLLVFGVFGSARAQFRAGNMEITLLGGGGSVTRNSSRSGIGGPASSSESVVYLSLSVMPGIYLTDGLSIEPEVQYYLESPEGSDAYSAYGLTACLSYTFLGGSVALPFVRAGYSVANGVHYPIFNDALAPVFSSDPPTVVGPYVGAGAKFLVGKQVALRVELGWRGQYYTRGSDPYTIDYSVSTVAVRFGFSFLTIGEDAAKK